MPRGGAFKHNCSCGVLSCANRSAGSGSCQWLGSWKSSKQSWDEVIDYVSPPPVTSWGGKWPMLQVMLPAECSTLHVASGADAEAWICAASSIESWIHGSPLGESCWYSVLPCV